MNVSVKKQNSFSCERLLQLPLFLNSRKVVSNGLSLCYCCKAVCVIHMPQRLYFACSSIHRHIIHYFRNGDIRDWSVIDS